MHVNRQRVFIWIPLLVCTIIALAYLWLPSLTSVMADDDTPRAGEDIAEIYRRVSKSVVSIEVEIGRFDVASGTEFVVDEYGHIVTNAHVVEDAFAIAVEFQDGLQTSAELIGMDTLVDIAVIKVDVRSYRLKPVTFGDSDDLSVGQSVLAIGNPFGLEATLTTGIISGLKREVEFDDGSILDGMIQTDAAIAPGSSGGPLLTPYGEVIGVNSAGYGSPFGGTNFGFAIPSNLVKRISENMIVQHSEFGRIGIAVPGSTPNNERAIVATPIVSTPQSQFELPKATPTATETDQPTVTDTIEPTATDTDEPTATNTAVHKDHRRAAANCDADRNRATNTDTHSHFDSAAHSHANSDRHRAAQPAPAGRGGNADRNVYSRGRNSDPCPADIDAAADLKSDRSGGVAGDATTSPNIAANLDGSPHSAANEYDRRAVSGGHRALGDFHA